ncbi:hypothetical protein PENSPDRAFT_612326, partial [Peniophora sp. CONT]
DIDFDAAASAFPDISLDGTGDFPLSTSGGGGFDIDSFDPEPVSRDVAVTGDEDGVIEKFESEFPELESTPALPPVVQQTPSFGAPSTPFAPRPQASANPTPFLAQAVQEEEPDVIREWRERQQEEIAKRDEESKARRQETISKAERALDNFYEEYTASRKAQIAQNKDDESAFISDLTESLAQGTTWDRICKLIELKDSQSKTLARAGPGTTELLRFREVLLRLRREGESAPGAAGY